MTDAHAILAQETFTPQLIMLLGVVILIGTLLWRRALRRNRAARPDGRAQYHARQHSARLGVQAQEDIQEMMVRLEELSREICGQIDTRYTRLERVLAEADRKLKALEAARRQAQPAPSADPVPAPDLPPPADPRHVEIHDRRQAGETPIEIARTLRMHVGEVELVLSLERSRRGLAQVADPPAEPDPPAPRLDHRA